MKPSRSAVRCKTYALPQLKFENQALTSFAGLVLVQKFFAALDLKGRLAKCFHHLNGSKVFDRSTLFLQLIVHVLLGYRELRDACHYQEDPLVQRVLGLGRLPDVATLSRMLQEADAKSVERLRYLLRGMVQDRLLTLALARVTLDFDGTVQSTKRRAEGSAVGFNKKKKGARSYYPLFCTIAQTGQVLDVLHRPGNVHDSNGAKAFMLACIEAVRAVAPGARIEVRMDSAFFSDAIVGVLDDWRVAFTISVPFERFAALKEKVERRRWWWRANSETSYFETDWKPQSWDRRFRFLFIRTRVAKLRKEPVQLDLFEPRETGYEFKVIVTNQTVRAGRVVAFHAGRGSQEGVFGELKSHCHLDYVPVRTLYGNQTYLLASVLAHNLARELQMQTTKPSRRTTAQRASLWAFEKLDTLRKTLIQRAGRLTRPRGVRTLTIGANARLQNRILQMLEALPARI